MLQRVFTDPSRLFYEHIPDLWRDYNHVAIPFFLLLPLALCDMLRYSHRLVGPLVRVHRGLNALANGQDVERLKLRGADEWHQIADAFNRVAEELRELRGFGSPPSDDGHLTDASRDGLELSRT